MDLTREIERLQRELQEAKDRERNKELELEETKNADDAYIATVHQQLGKPTLS